MKSADFHAFIKINGLTQKSVSEYLEVSPSFMNQIAKGERAMPTDKLRKLLEHPTWDTSPLLNRAKNDTPTYEHPYNLAPTQKPAVVPTAEPTSTTVVPDSNIPAWLPTSDDVEEVKAEEVPFIEKSVIESREVDIREHIEAGDVKRIIPQGLIKTGVSFARKIYSDAMAPDIREGDIILCTFLPDTSSLVDGDIYTLDTTKFGCVIRDIQHDGDGIILKARNHKYPDLRVDQNEILSVAVPMQLIRSTFSQRTDYVKIIQDKDERIDLLVTRERAHVRQTDKQLEHIDKLLEVIDKVTTKQSEIIDRITDKKQ